MIKITEEEINNLMAITKSINSKLIIFVKHEKIHIETDKIGCFYSDNIDELSKEMGNAAFYYNIGKKENIDFLRRSLDRKSKKIDDIYEELKKTKEKLQYYKSIVGEGRQDTQKRRM